MVRLHPACNVSLLGRICPEDDGRQVGGHAKLDCDATILVRAASNQLPPSANLKTNTNQTGTDVCWN